MCYDNHILGYKGCFLTVEQLYRGNVEGGKFVLFLLLVECVFVSYFMLLCGFDCVVAVRALRVVATM
jgi:hypothetical protein